MECIQASCMHLFPSPGKRSCRDNNNSRNSNAARELVVARSLEGETAGDFPPSCSYGLQGSSSARRKCREEGFKGWQKFILQSTQADKKLGSNRIDTVETVDNVLWLGNIFLHPGASHRRRKCGVCHAISTTGDNWGKSNSRGRRGKPKEERPQERQLELLAEVRRRRELEMLQREQLSSQAETVKDESAVKIWPFWRKKEFKLRALTRRIVELSNRKQLGKIFEELEIAKKENGKLNHIIMNAVLMACVNCKDIDYGLRVFNEMAAPGGTGVDNVTYGTLLKGLGEARRLDDAFELLESMEAGTAPGQPELTNVHLNTLVNACADAGEALRARGVLLRYRSSVRKSGLTTFTYNLLIKGYARSDNPLEALKLMDEMKSHGLQLQRLTYNSLILACVRGGDMARAFELLTAMKEDAKRLQTSRLLPDVVTYTTLLRGLADVGDLEGVCNMVTEMKEMPTCVLDRVAYTAIIDACIASGSPERGLAYAEEMQRNAKDDVQLRPRAHVFLALMRAFAERGDVTMVGSLRSRLIPEAAGHVWPEDRAEADELYIEAAVLAGQVKMSFHNHLICWLFLSAKFAIWHSHYWSFLLIVSLSVSSPLYVEQVSPNEGVESIMVPYDEARPPLGDIQVRKVALRFLREQVLPIVDERGACIGVVFAEDCSEMDARLKDIMRPPPPMVTSSTPISKAITLLLDPQTKILVVLNSRTTYFPNKEDEVSEKVLGFVTKGMAFDLGHSHPFGSPS
ncbi:unnamed protein product [Sphagnum jensenii]|uniref:CBS domain-containing protein n=1 Tax=Sphagnum jensenii TaxID=128206 RepID=A0ABP0VUR9_9BRYO